MTDFNNANHKALFLTGTTISSLEALHASDLVFHALAERGVWNHGVVTTTQPTDRTRLWADDSTEPAVLKAWKLDTSTWGAATFRDVFPFIRRDGDTMVSGRFGVPDGTAAAPVLFANSDPDTGWFKSADGTWSFTSNGTVKLVIGPNGITVNGNVNQQSTTNTSINDNEVTLNSGESGAGVTAGKSGLRVERGTATDAVLHFNETTDVWEGGVDGAAKPFAIGVANPTTGHALVTGISTAGLLASRSLNVKTQGGLAAAVLGSEVQYAIDGGNMGTGLAAALNAADGVLTWDTSASAPVKYTPAEFNKALTALTPDQATIDFAADKLKGWDTSANAPAMFTMNSILSGMVFSTIGAGVDMLHTNTATSKVFRRLKPTANGGLSVGTDTDQAVQFGLDAANLQTLAAGTVAAADSFFMWDASTNTPRKVVPLAAGRGIMEATPVASAAEVTALTGAEVVLVRLASGATRRLTLSQLVDKGVDNASETDRGKVELATVAEVQAGTDTERAVTPAGLAARTATETRTGILELATSAEVIAGTDAVRAVTPAGLSARTATDARTGIVELATAAETIAGTDASRAVTPASLNARTATETRTGILELATVVEAQTGTDTVRAVTPAGLKAHVDAAITAGATPDASATVKGKVELATNAETIAGTDATRAVTPAGLAALTATDARRGIVELATNAEALAGTDAQRALTSANLKHVLDSKKPVAGDFFSASGDFTGAQTVNIPSATFDRIFTARCELKATIAAAGGTAIGAGANITGARMFLPAGTAGSFTITTAAPHAAICNTYHVWGDPAGTK